MFENAPRKIVFLLLLAWGAFMTGFLLEDTANAIDYEKITPTDAGLMIVGTLFAAARVIWICLLPSILILGVMWITADDTAPKKEN